MKLKHKKKIIKEIIRELKKLKSAPDHVIQRSDVNLDMSRDFIYIPARYNRSGEFEENKSELRKTNYTITLSIPAYAVLRGRYPR